MGRRGLWTGLRLEQISGRLKQLGLWVCSNTVRRLLDLLGYALHANRKSLSGPQSPERDRQFQYIQHQRQQFTQSALPIISVDGCSGDYNCPLAEDFFLRDLNSPQTS